MSAAEDAFMTALSNLWTEPEDVADYPDWYALPGRMLAALEATGWVLVKLPEPYPDWHGGLSAWCAGVQGDDEVAIRKSDGRISFNVATPFDTAEQAMKAAAALIAAAYKKAEEELVNTHTHIPEQRLVELRAAGYAAGNQNAFVDPTVLHRCTKVLTLRGEQWAAAVLGRDISARSKFVPAMPALRAGEEYTLVAASDEEDSLALERMNP